MKRISIIFCTAMALLGVLSTDALAQDPCICLPTDNLVRGAQVRLEGSFFNGSGDVVKAQTVVDGVFLPRGQAWNRGGVWWIEGDGKVSSIFLTFPGAQITSLTIQADDNDAYEVSYLNDATDTWRLAWAVPNFDSRGNGMLTRPDDQDNRQRFVLPSPIAATELRLRATSGDGHYSISEVQAFGKRF